MLDLHSETCMMKYLESAYFRAKEIEDILSSLKASTEALYAERNALLKTIYTVEKHVRNSEAAKKLSLREQIDRSFDIKEPI